MKKQIKISKLKLNKLNISQLPITSHIRGGGDDESVDCTQISIAICSLPTEQGDAVELSV